jgi:hypothetical protein
MSADDERYLTRREFIAYRESDQRRFTRLENGQLWIMRGLGGIAFALFVQVIISTLINGG